MWILSLSLFYTAELREKQVHVVALDSRPVVLYAEVDQLLLWIVPTTHFDCAIAVAKLDCVLEQVQQDLRDAVLVCAEVTERLYLVHIETNLDAFAVKVEVFKS
jgi:hypothetical protein